MLPDDGEAARPQGVSGVAKLQAHVRFARAKDVAAFRAEGRVEAPALWHRDDDPALMHEVRLLVPDAVWLAVVWSSGVELLRDMEGMVAPTDGQGGKAACGVNASVSQILIQ